MEQLQDWFSNLDTLSFGSINVLINQKSAKTAAIVIERAIIAVF